MVECLNRACRFARMHVTVGYVGAQGAQHLAPVRKPTNSRDSLSIEVMGDETGRPARGGA